MRKKIFKDISWNHLCLSRKRLKILEINHGNTCVYINYRKREKSFDEFFRLL